MKKMSLSLQMMIALVLGVVLGLISQGSGIEGVVNGILTPVGTIFMNLIKMIVVPLVFSTIVVGACGLGDIKRFGKIGGKTLIYFMATTALASVIGLTLAKLFSVGSGFVISTENLEFTVPEADFVKTLVSFVPTNIFQALANGDMIPIILTAILIGAGIIKEGSGAASLYNGIRAFSDVMLRITNWIMKLAPLGIFAMMTTTVIGYGAKALLPMLKLIVVIYIGFILHILVVYGGSIKLLGKKSPVLFFKEAFKTMVFAFTSQTSSACLPFSMEATKKLGVPFSVRSFVLPLGATINMDGTALYQSICTVFIATIYGIPLTLSQLVIVVLTATAASVGTAGVPNGGMATFGMVLMAAGLPVEGVALISGLIGIIGMGSTTLNITGDMACSVIVSRGEMPDEEGDM